VGVSSRLPHDEFWKFLGPYGWSRGYLGPDGKPSPPGLIPTLEESVDQRVWVIGNAEEVAEGIDWYRQGLGLQDLTIFPGYPGDSYDKCEEQLARFAEEVAPLLGSPLTVHGPAVPHGGIGASRR
jgi:alkanesulfonate monooxygenase SsuD/methylene tetrahydromethanopterin reductase-like flavin-dependent oxidoreductase (luciferase family)